MATRGAPPPPPPPGSKKPAPPPEVIPNAVVNLSSAPPPPPPPGSKNLINTLPPPLPSDYSIPPLVSAPSAPPPPGSKKFPPPPAPISSSPSSFTSTNIPPPPGAKKFPPPPAPVSTTSSFTSSNIPPPGAKKFPPVPAPISSTSSSPSFSSPNIPPPPGSAKKFPTVSAPAPVSSTPPPPTVGPKKPFAPPPPPPGAKSQSSSQEAHLPPSASKLSGGPPPPPMGLKKPSVLPGTRSTGVKPHLRPRPKNERDIPLIKKWKSDIDEEIHTLVKNCDTPEIKFTWDPESLDSYYTSRDYCEKVLTSVNTNIQKLPEALFAALNTLDSSSKEKVKRAIGTVIIRDICLLPNFDMPDIFIYKDKTMQLAVDFKDEHTNYSGDLQKKIVLEMNRFCKEGPYLESMIKHIVYEAGHFTPAYCGKCKSANCIHLMY